MANPVDRFHAALTVLAGNGHIKQRLIKAFGEYLVDIHEDELPLAMRESFADLCAAMHRVSPLNGEGPICASVRKMSLAEAGDCAGQVVVLYGELLRSVGDEPAHLGASPDEQPRVPPFLVKSV